MCLHRLCLLTLLAVLPAVAQPGSEVLKSFRNPPDDARIMMRWWWFGPGVTKPELEKEMRMMKAGGIGGFEVQPVYPLALDDDKLPFKNLTYLSPEFLDAVRFTSEKARELGLRMDMTLCSGWPYGGPYVSAAHASTLLRIEHVPIKPGETSFALPAMIESEKLIAAFLAKTTEFQPLTGGRRNHPLLNIQESHQLTIKRDGISGRLELPADLRGANTVLVFIRSLTGQQVKRPSIGSEGFVLNHYDREAVETHLKVVGDRLLQTLGNHPPYAVFSDSLEVYAADWTPDFLDQFRKRRGYDLTPLLPALAGDIGEKTLAVRHDWAKTLTELVDENYLTPINEWAKQHGTRFRSQTYGYPPVMMSSNSLVALPEGEGPQWRSLSSTRWASSASHLYNRPVTSSETWTWLHSPVFRATPLDMKAEADLHFLEGINQLIGHGWPYSPDIAGEPGWRFYAAAVFNHHNPWWLVMPDITKYLQRVSFALRQGKPANDVAIYLATDDAWAHMQNGQATINNYLARTLNPELIPQILDAGYNFDFIDDRAIESAGIPFKILVLPEVERIALSSYLKIVAFASKGGVVVAEGHAPTLDDRSVASPQIAQISKGIKVVQASLLGATLKPLVQPDFQVAEHQSAIGIVHRKLDAGDLYFVVNTGNQPIHTKATVRITGKEPQWWDPMSGEVYRADNGVTLDLAPYESRILAYLDQPAANAAAMPSAANTSPIDLSSDWTLTLAGHTAAPIHMDKLHSWADEPALKYYSGEMDYQKTVDVPASYLQGKSVVLDFGEGTVVPDPHRTGPGMRALMESPVREAAVVNINGQRVGAIWHPPYQLDVTKFLHAGKNEIHIMVGNLALNEMAARPLPNYKLLNVRYGERFQAQDMDQVQVMPSGITGPVRLVSR
ncbi:MAG TPA: glycosyl hydrolase [Bryobacteraceae bacterium]|jgi:hypothetical protein